MQHVSCERSARMTPTSNPMPNALPRALALVLLGAVACASGGARTVVAAAPGEVEVPASAPVIIRVRSDFAAPLSLYSVSEGVATRLGDVPGRQVVQFQLAATQIPSDGLTLLAVPRDGDARASSGKLRLAPGNVVEFVIGATLADANATVRSP
jgi:hypothetical protein